MKYIDLIVHSAIEAAFAAVKIAMRISVFANVVPVSDVINSLFAHVTVSCIT